MKKILYLITATETSMGGHYYSLLETAIRVREHLAVTVVSIGLKKSPVLELLETDYIHVPYTGVCPTAIALHKLLKCEMPDVLHAFDSNSFFFGRIVSVINRLPIVLTRCGGPNPKRFPYNDEIVLFSLENYEYLTGKIKFKHANISFIPNRVREKRQDEKRIKTLKHLYGGSHPVILRISRISSHHEKSIIQAINLTKLLNRDGIKAKLIVLGFVEDNDVFNKLLTYQAEDVFFETRNEFTVNASTLIGVADYVVGTGRGFMEAALMGKIMLAPTSNTQIPVLVDLQNVNKIFKENFSSRYYECSNEDIMFKKIQNTFDDKLNGDVDLKAYAYKNFSSDFIYERHETIYQRATIAKVNIYELLVQYATVINLKGKVKNLLKKYTSLKKALHDRP